MEDKKIQDNILHECVDCVKAWKNDNWQQPVDIDYEDYLNMCYNHGGANLAGLIDELSTGADDESLQDFYERVSYACDKENYGIRHAVGQRIKTFRLRRGMTQQDLADAAGITKANVCNIEAGKYSVGLDILNKIANALGVKIELK